MGTIVEILIANRLLRPKALFWGGTWAQSAAVTDYYGLTVEQLNDDRLGRALERIAQHADTILAALVLKAIERFRVDVHRIHHDISNIELYGAYQVDLTKGQAPPTPMPAYGRTKSGSKHVKQVQFVQARDSRPSPWKSTRRGWRLACPARCSRACAVVSAGALLQPRLGGNGECSCGTIHKRFSHSLGPRATRPQFN